MGGGSIGLEEEWLEGEEPTLQSGTEAKENSGSGDLDDLASFGALEVDEVDEVDEVNEVEEAWKAAAAAQHAPPVPLGPKLEATAEEIDAAFLPAHNFRLIGKVVSIASHWRRLAASHRTEGSGGISEEEEDTFTSARKEGTLKGAGGAEIGGREGV